MGLERGTVGPGRDCLNPAARAGRSVYRVHGTAGLWSPVIMSPVIATSAPCAGAGASGHCHVPCPRNAVSPPRAADARGDPGAGLLVSAASLTASRARIALIFDHNACSRYTSAATAGTATSTVVTAAASFAGASSRATGLHHSDPEARVAAARVARLSVPSGPPYPIPHVSQPCTEHRSSCRLRHR